jgi:GNAT superfamily N-acetyltransferase
MNGLAAVERARAEGARCALSGEPGDPPPTACSPARYRLRGFENVLVQAAAGPAPIPEGVRSRRAVRISARIDVVTARERTQVSLDESYPRDLLEGVMADMASADGFSRFLARRDGVAAGGASLRLFEGVAQLCGAATRPEHRRRGVQSALLARRLAIAVEAGCDVAIVTTQPGSKSQEDVQRHGIRPALRAAILVRAA